MALALSTGDYRHPLHLRHAGIRHETGLQPYFYHTRIRIELTTSTSTADSESPGIDMVNMPQYNLTVPHGRSTYLQMSLK
jgi:hypothetical protein